jgi:hypothetical protein
MYDSEIIYPNNSVVITSEQYEEYIKLKAQMEKVDEEDEEVEEVKTTMKVTVNNNIKMDVLEDIVIKKDKKPEVNKPKVINTMNEENDNDQTPNKRKDKRPLRPKPPTEPTHHKISDIQKLELFFKKMRKT